MEQPYSLGFQADSLVRSGSISFGRFETESLSWERRSSFSHNRYLEEVEKFSKPGSVTEKKAYFEAHFKKKAHLLQNTSLWQDGAEYQTHESNMLDGMDNSEETEHANNKDSIHFDESPDRSESHGEYCLMKFGGNNEISHVEPHVEPSSNNVYSAVDSEIRACENYLSNSVATSVGIGYFSNDNSHCDHLDENSNASGYHEESQEIKFEGKDTVDPQVELPSNHVYCVMDGKNKTSETNMSVQMNVEIEYVNEDSQLHHFDASSVDSGYHGEILEIKFEKGTEITHHEPQAASASDTVDCVEDSVPKQLEPEKAHQTETEGHRLLLIKVDQDVEPKQNINLDAEKDGESLKSVDASYKSREAQENGNLVVKDAESLKSVDASYKSQEAEENGNLGLVHRQNPSPKESKLAKPIKNSRTNLTGIRRSMLTEASKDSAKIASRRDTMNPLRRKPEKKPSRVSASATHSMSSASKAEESESSRVKLLYENKREKESKAKKVVAPRPSTPEKLETRERQTANRSKHPMNLTNQGIRQSATGVNVRRDELAERRKEESENLKAKLLHENKREKEFRTKKAVSSRPSTPQKFESQGRLSAYRPEQTVNSTDQDTRQSPTAAYNFNCGGRAERRKEFYMMLEEKMHAKEAEINQIQTRTQEKMEAEIKQFRRSLNFRAKPMPSFYQVAAMHGPDCRKAASASTKSTNSQGPSSNPRKSMRAITPCSKRGDRSLPRASESANGNGPPATPESNAVVARKIQQEKICTNFQKHRISERNEVIKSQGTGGKKKVGTSSGSKTRKEIKQ